jgi:hypothetical protein
MEEKMRKIVLFTIVMLVAVLMGACGATPAPTSAPAGPPALTVQGKVNQELKLTLDDVKALGVEKLTLEHPKNGPTEYEGVRLSKVLDKAGLATDATTLVLTASDGFSAEVAVADAKACADCLIAIDGNSLNMAMAGMSSKAWVKTIVTIEVK